MVEWGFIVWEAVHGVDFTFEGHLEALAEVAGALKRVWLVKAARFGDQNPFDDKEVSILNRIFRWFGEGLLYGVDPRQRRSFSEMMM